MSATERQEKIIEIISKAGSMSVEELTSILDVSNMTIRRDLTALENDGVLKRTHGKAVMCQETDYVCKAGTEVSEKQKIAEVSARLVRPRDTIFLDSGTTTYEIAKRIMHIENLVVITNDINIAFLLHQCSNIEVMCCGGIIQKETGSTFGFFANQLVGYVQMDKAFIGAASINEKFNILTPTVEKATLKRMVVNNANESYLVVDSSKFNRKALMKINNMSAYTGVITTKQFSPEELERIKKLNIHILSVTA